MSRNSERIAIFNIEEARVLMDMCSFFILKGKPTMKQEMKSHELYRKAKNYLKLKRAIE